MIALNQSDGAVVSRKKLGTGRNSGEATIGAAGTGATLRPKVPTVVADVPPPPMLGPDTPASRPGDVSAAGTAAATAELRVVATWAAGETAGTGVAMGAAEVSGSGGGTIVSGVGIGPSVTWGTIPTSGVGTGMVEAAGIAAVETMRALTTLAAARTVIAAELTAVRATNSAGTRDRPAIARACWGEFTNACPRS